MEWLENLKFSLSSIFSYPVKMEWLENLKFSLSFIFSYPVKMEWLENLKFSLSFILLPHSVFNLSSISCLYNLCKSSAFKFLALPSFFMI